MAKSRTALPVLLSHVLLALEHDYESTKSDVPPLPFLSNLLRVIGPDGEDLKKLPELGNVTERAIRISTQASEKIGWIKFEPVRKGLKLTHLTVKGKEAKAAGQRRLAATERAWQKRFGADNVDLLRDSLVQLVSKIDVELPHYPSGYGQGDTSIHGGNHVKGQEGPPRIPSHGTEWPVVLREDRDAVALLPLSALLSQALCAFAIDYEASAESSIANLHTIFTFLRYVPDEGMSLADAKKLGGVNGTGRSTFERHLLVTVKEGVAYLTDHGKRVRDRYPARVVEVEKDWGSLYGRKVVSSLRKELEKFEQLIDAEMPDYPDVSGWLRRN